VEKGGEAVFKTPEEWPILKNPLPRKRGCTRGRGKSYEKQSSTFEWGRDYKRRGVRNWDIFIRERFGQGGGTSGQPSAHIPAEKLERKGGKFGGGMRERSGCDAFCRKKILMGGGKKIFAAEHVKRGRGPAQESSASGLTKSKTNWKKDQFDSKTAQFRNMLGSSSWCGCLGRYRPRRSFIKPGGEEQHFK